MSRIIDSVNVKIDFTQMQKERKTVAYAKHSGHHHIWLNQPHHLSGFIGYKLVWSLWNTMATSPTDG